MESPCSGGVWAGDGEGPCSETFVLGPLGVYGDAPHVLLSGSSHAP